MDLKTLMGFTFEEFRKKLDEQLPVDAYSAVPGGANLTDIDPGYMRQVLTTLLGPCGIGWGIKYDVNDLTVYSDTKRTSGGGERDVTIATLKRLDFWYVMVDENGNNRVGEIPASGGSENANPQYAMKGAITNALGNAVSNLGFQESVYLGHRSHSTVKAAAGASAGKTVQPPSKPTVPSQQARPVTPAQPAKPVTQPARPATPVQPAKPATSAPATPVAPAVPATLPAVPQEPELEELEPAPQAADAPGDFVIAYGSSVGKRLRDVSTEKLDWFANKMVVDIPDKQALKDAAIAYLAMIAAAEPE